MHLYQVTATSASLMHEMQKRMRKKEIENETTFYVFICRCTVPYAFAQVEFQRVIHPYISNMCASQFCLWASRSHWWLARERRNEKEWKRERNNNSGLSKFFNISPCPLCKENFMFVEILNIDKWCKINQDFAFN